MNSKKQKKITDSGFSVDYRLAKAQGGYILSVEISASDRYVTKPLPISRAFANSLFTLLYSSQVTPVAANDVLRDKFVELLC